MTQEAILNQLGYAPNEALGEQLARIESNTVGFERIVKHIMDLHEALKTDKSYVAMSNTHDFLKIKIPCHPVSPSLLPGGATPHCRIAHETENDRQISGSWLYHHGDPGPYP